MANPYRRRPLPALGPEGRVMVEIDAALAPLVIRSVALYNERSAWVDQSAYEDGAPRVARLQGDIMTGVTGVTEAIDRLYRMLDSALNGTAYSVTGTGVEPAIPAAPPSAVGVAPGLRRQLLDAQGVLGAGWFGIGGTPATIADVVSALRVGSDAPQGLIDNRLEELLNAGSNATGVFGVVRSLLGDVADGILEGGMLSVLVASSLANAAMMGAQAAQLDRLIASLDGGGLFRPGDNVLQALRGDTVAGNGRSIVDRLSFDPGRDAGDWGGGVGQMLYDGLNYRHLDSADNPQVAPLSYLVANALGAPDDRPTAIVVLRAIQQLLETPQSNYAEVLADIYQQLYDAGSGRGVAQWLAYIDITMQQQLAQANIYSAAQVAQMRAQQSVLRDLLECVCEDEGVLSPCAIDDPSLTLRYELITPFPLRLVPISGAQGYYVYLGPVAAALDGATFDETPAIYVPGPTHYFVSILFPDAWPEGWQYTVSVGETELTELAVGGMGAGAPYYVGPDGAQMSIKVAPVEGTPPIPSSALIDGVRAKISRCVGLEGGATPPTVPPNPNVCDVESNTEVWLFSEWQSTRVGDTTHWTAIPTISNGQGYRSWEVFDTIVGQYKWRVGTNVDTCIVLAGERNNGDAVYVLPIGQLDAVVGAPEGQGWAPTAVSSDGSTPPVTYAMLAVTEDGSRPGFVVYVHVTASPS